MLVAFEVNLYQFYLIKLKLRLSQQQVLNDFESIPTWKWSLVSLAGWVK